MKRLALLALNLLAVAAAAVVFVAVYTIPSFCKGSPGWADIALCIAEWAMMVGALVLAFLPFRRSQRELPVFFRAHIFVPVLFVLWVVCGSAFPFSPHQLTRVLPGFLLGANDWGVGNIYTYTKLADWVALLAGCAACTRLASGGASAANGFAKRFRLCFPHLLAAATLHVVPPVFTTSFQSALDVDNGRLFVWLLAGFTLITALQSLADDLRSRWPMVLSWLVAFGWLFVPVADFRP